MSPEQASGDVVGPPSDVFSAGVVLYEMLSGGRPFRGSSNAEVIRAVLSSEPPALSSLAPDVPEALIQIVETCLRKSPDSRYRDANEMASHLRALEHTSGPVPELGATTVTMNLQTQAPSRRRGRRNLYVATGLLALAAMFAGYRWRLGHASSNPPRGAAAQAQAETLERAQTLLQRYDRKGNIDSAIALLEPLAAQAGASASVHAALAEAYVRKYNESADKQWLPKSVESGRRAVRVTQDLAAAHVSFGMALAASGQKTEAAAEFERARDLNPLSGPAHVGLAKLRSGSEAQQLFQKAIELSPGQWIPYNELGAFYWREARYGESVAAWREALRLAPGNVLAIRNLGAGLHMKGEYAEAADKFQRALELDETNATTWANLATARYFQGRYLDAVRAAEKSVEFAPGRYLYWGNLGDAYRWAEGLKSKAGGAYHNAIRLVRERMALAPNDAALNIRLAAYLAKSGDTQAALRELAQKRKAVENDSGSLFNAALVFELAGDRKSALDALERAILAGYSMHEVTNEPELAALRSDPRYPRISLEAAGRGKE
jgi:serine/threonine-protein kinase